MSHRRFPSYPDDADYNTNAPSYYEDLARKQALIKELAERIWGYEETLNLSMQEIAQRFIEWDGKIAAFDGDVNVLLQEWIGDGTFDHIINDTIFGWKANQSDLEDIQEDVIAVNNRINNIIATVGDGTIPTELLDTRVGADGTVYDTSKERLDTEYTNKLTKLQLDNDIENGNFSVPFNVNTGWTFTLATNVLDTISKTDKLTPTARLGQLFQNRPLIAGRKYYLAARVKTTKPEVYLNAYYSPSSLDLAKVAHSGSGNYENLTSIITPTATANVTIRVIDFKTSGWDEISIQNFILIDLTAAFGVGNEPTAALVESLINANYPTKWFDGLQYFNAFVGDVFTVIKSDEPDLLLDVKNKRLKAKYDKALDQMSVCFKISPTKNGKVVISKTGANSLMMLKQFEYLTSDNLDYFTTGTTIGGTTDWLSPITMSANANGDGDTSFTTTGGNHLMNGGVTAWTRSYTVLVDGVPLTATSNILDCDVVVIKVRNQIEGYNTHSLGRVILDEYVTYTIKNGVVSVEVSLIPIEDITVLNYYGLQFTSTLATHFNSIQYVNSLNNEFNATVADGTNAGAISTEILDTFILKGANVSFVGYVDRTKGLGTRENANLTDASFMINGIKLYSNLIRKSTVLKARTPYFWKGSYEMKGSN